MTIFEKNTKNVEEGFLATVINKAYLFALLVTAVVVIVTIVDPFSVSENQTVMYLLLIVISMMAVILSCRPFSKLRVFLCITMVLGTVSALVLFRPLFVLSPVNSAMMAFVVSMFGGILLMMGIFAIMKKKL